MTITDHSFKARGKTKFVTCEDSYIGKSKAFCCTVIQNKRDWPSPGWKRCSQPLSTTKGQPLGFWQPFGIILMCAGHSDPSGRERDTESMTGQVHISTVYLLGMKPSAPKTDFLAEFMINLSINILFPFLSYPCFLPSGLRASRKRGDQAGS